eukprot:gnl/MRDRNA2_/MRDRNA2_85319_c0_seq1.p1 gnl/MRDRNA2_/MRDRNA2_85319_c0~~gnl/MRDRNA2_/MRDRNA2_85319_c0_seq1.p1  ORF type:complete len:180 (-),score=44.66 gnl/MRDRNA2_/MRDRNA2_85319_c0_seq1:333-872(-)
MYAQWKQAHNMLGTNFGDLHLENSKLMEIISRGGHEEEYCVIDLSISDSEEEHDPAAGDTVSVSGDSLSGECDESEKASEKVPDNEESSFSKERSATEEHHAPSTEEASLDEDQDEPDLNPDSFSFTQCFDYVRSKRAIVDPFHAKKLCKFQDNNHVLADLLKGLESELQAAHIHQESR